MKRLSGLCTLLGSALGRALRGFASGRAGNIATITALMIVPLVGISGLGIEVSDWWLTKRAIQNATDSAAIAAATNAGQQCANGGATWSTTNKTITCSSLTTNCTSGTATNFKTFDCEAAANAAKYGFVDGSNNVTVTAALTTVNCPDSSTGCYTVTIAKTLPINLMRAIGMTGSQTIRAYAVASSPVQSGQYCLMGVGTTGGSNTNDLSISGGGSANAPIDLGGCDTFSNESDACNGANAKADFGISIGNYAGNSPGNQQCGATSAVAPSITYTTIANTDMTGSPTYSSMANNLPTPSACGSYSHVADTGYSSVASNNYTVVAGGTKTVSTASGQGGWTTAGGITYLKVCGDLSLQQSGGKTGTVSFDTSGGPVVLIVEDGGIYLNGNTLTETGGSSGGLTIVFQGTSGDTNPRSFVDTKGGLVNYSAPATGSNSPFQGVALYYDTSNNTCLKTGNCSKAGDPTVDDLNYTGGGTSGQSGYNMDITGLVWDPTGNFAISGSINHATAGLACFGVVAATITITGGGYIFPDPTSQCSNLGMPLPTTSATIRTSLIQ
jgi:Flp pilus assembly protein TadG